MGGGGAVPGGASAAGEQRWRGFPSLVVAVTPAVAVRVASLLGHGPPAAGKGLETCPDLSQQMQ